MEKLYIAYGSNMDAERMARRCPEAELLGTGELKGYRLLFRGSKSGFYATIERAAGYSVPVLCWSITRHDEQRLDYYEGFPNFYYKDMITVNLDGKQQDGLVYIMPKEHPFGLPNTSYYNLIARAYKALGFDLGILDRAMKDTEEYVK